MQIEQLIQCHIPPRPDNWRRWVPADNISRQAWQEAVDALVLAIRDAFDDPSFKLTPAEISIFHHRTLAEFAELIAEKLS